MQMVTRDKPVVLTGFDLVVDCPTCRTKQIMSDQPELRSTLGQDEHVSLHALPGRYVLNYSFKCWNCEERFAGLLTIRSRAASA